ncbi:hypothetical protein LY56_03582 [Roseinatronobacter thiooxidans]|uniref:Uncharacterized protein n=1 Tax=Roseinatronobacter thiooxidans TaxID=121821 RepID=A0A2W7PHT9_9RHOB|nr:hypothetical protein LY56_03582 [Roseinatronobacter thiooxidans]
MAISLVKAPRTPTQTHLCLIKKVPKNDVVQETAPATHPRHCAIHPEHSHSEEVALPPPHPALVEMVRLLARVSARQARSEHQETKQ